MNTDQRRKAYRQADEALLAARDHPDLAVRMNAVRDNIAAKLAVAPRVDNQGRIIADNAPPTATELAPAPSPSDLGGDAA